MKKHEDTATLSDVGSTDGLDSVDYLLECFNGGSFYVPIRSISELDQWRDKNPEHEGILYTKDGYLVNEKAWRKKSNAELRREP